MDCLCTVTGWGVHPTPVTTNSISGQGTSSTLNGISMTARARYVAPPGIYLLGKYSSLLVGFWAYGWKTCGYFGAKTGTDSTEKHPKTSCHVLWSPLFLRLEMGVFLQMTSSCSTFQLSQLWLILHNTLSLVSCGMALAALTNKLEMIRLLKRTAFSEIRVGHQSSRMFDHKLIFDVVERYALYNLHARFWSYLLLMNFKFFFLLA